MDGFLNGWMDEATRSPVIPVLPVFTCLVALKSATVLRACVLQWLSVIESDLHGCSTECRPSSPARVLLQAKSPALCFESSVGMQSNGLTLREKKRAENTHMAHYAPCARDARACF